MRRNRSGITLGFATAAIAAFCLLAPPALATDARPGRVAGTALVKPPVRAVAQPNGHVNNHDRAWTDRKHTSGPCYPFGCNYRGPTYPFGPRYSKAPAHVGPTYVVPRHPGRHWVAGHWAQQWVPQYYTYQVWVPGYYAGTWWVPGHYQQATEESGGYYQQVWVDGYWEE
jgi:hypothetical protein